MATTTNLEPERGWELLPAFGSSGTSDRTKNFARARRHTRAVKFLRLVLPVCAAGVVVVTPDGRVARRGSAIFVHVARPGLEPTAGCVALPAASLRRLLARMSRKTRIKIH